MPKPRKPSLAEMMEERELPSDWSSEVSAAAFAFVTSLLKDGGEKWIVSRSRTYLKCHRRFILSSDGSQWSLRLTDRGVTVHFGRNESAEIAELFEERWPKEDDCCERCGQVLP